MDNGSNEIKTAAEVTAEAATETVADQQKKKKSGRHLSPQEQLERIAQQQKELAARARAIRAREDAKARKARAHRLILVGAVVEAVYGDAISGDSMLKALDNFLRTRQAELARALAEATEESAASDAETL
ncbi:MAG: hypothetical protein E7199_07760 [Schwartzia succinivorans]|nr:hypothetical protein [Schwartzia succinivorans]